MLRRLYDRMIALSASPRALPALAAVSAAESSFFPLPPDAMLVPMVLARPERAWTYAAVCTVASVLGGLVGYAIGALLYDQVGRPVLEFYGLGAKGAEFQQFYARWGAVAILLKGLLPIPYKLVTIVSGVAGYDLVAFTLLSLLTRGARFFGLVFLLRRYGLGIRAWIEANLGLAVSGLLASVVLGFVLVGVILR